MYKCRTESPGFHFDDDRDPVEKIEFEDARREFLSDVREGDQLSVLHVDVLPVLKDGDSRSL